MYICDRVLPQSVTVYGSSMLGGSVPTGQPLEIDGASQPGLVTNNGLVLYGTDGKAVSVSNTVCVVPSPRLVAALHPFCLVISCW